MRIILSPAERIRNARIKEIMKAKQVSNEDKKASQNQNKGANNEDKPRYLTSTQMDKVKDLQREGMSREEAVAWALENIK